MHLIGLLGYLQGLFHITVGISKTTAISKQLGTIGITIGLLGELRNEIFYQLRIGQRIWQRTSHIKRQQGLIDIIGQSLLDMGGAQHGVVDTQAIDL